MARRWRACTMRVVETRPENNIPDHVLERVGSTLKGKWRLERLIGVGGMASVYAATHRNGKRVAVKILHPELATRHDVRARFLQEGYAANSLEHRGAVSILDDEVDEEGMVFLVMDLIDGETVERRLKRKGGRLEPEEVLAVAHELLDVLDAAHGRGIIHRDIKPENLMISRDGALKVLDFGIARLRESAATVTRSGTALG